MKNLAIVFALMMLMASCTQVKIAYVDVEEILKEYEGSKKAEEEMKAQSEEISRQLDQLAVPFQQKVQEYQKNQQNLSASERQKQESELMQQQQIIQQQQQMAQQQVQAAGQEKMEKINSDIEDFLSDYAVSKGFTYILGSSEQTKSVLYGEASLDITEEVISALNESYSIETPADTTSVKQPVPVN
jgi:outer membrane protein